VAPGEGEDWDAIWESDGIEALPFLFSRNTEFRPAPGRLELGFA